MTLEAIQLRFFQVVARKKRHKHYAHTVAKHKDYLALVAGVGLDERLKQYVRREDEALFKQRVTLTHHVVTAVSKMLLDPFYKVPRSNSGRRVLTYKTDTNKEDGAEKKIGEVEDLLSTFWGTESWDDYMATRFVELNSVDPNAFVCFEFKPFDAQTELVRPYPYEASSVMAVDYRYVNKVLEYLVVKDDHSYRVAPDPLNAGTTGTGGTELPDPAKTHKKGSKYTLYTKNQTFQLQQVAETEVNGLAGLREGVVKQTNEGDYVKLGQDYYRFVSYDPHNCDKVPAFRVGYYRDLSTNGQTFVSPIHPAVPYLDKSIKTNSELDLVATLLAFPQMIMYGEACQDEGCYKGYYESGKACNTCNGTGIKASAPSAQDAIVLSMPRDREQMVPLKDILTYINPPVDIVKWQEEYVDKLVAKARQIMYNSDVYDRKQIAQTATGATIDMQNIYDALHPFSVKWGKSWSFGTTIIAKLADRGKGLVASYTFGKDFKLKTLDGLIYDLSVANGIGNGALVQHLNYDIANIIFSEKPLELQRYRLQELYNPFRGKSEKEISVLMLTDFVSRKDKVLHANYGRIFDELEIEYATKGQDFYQLNRTAQRQAIYDKVDEIIAAISDENPAPTLDLN